MSTILIKNVPKETLKELKRLKVELGCQTWADLLVELANSYEPTSNDEEQKRRMKKGLQGLLNLQNKVTAKWTGPSVLEEMRRTKRHEKQ